MKQENYYKAVELDYSLRFYRGLLNSLSASDVKMGHIVASFRDLEFNNGQGNDKIKPFIEALKKATEVEISKLEAEFEAL